MQTKSDYYSAVKEAVIYLKERLEVIPQVAVSLGTGLGGLTDNMHITSRINYSEIPNFPTSTVKSHAGELLYGNLDGADLLCFSGRTHYYEGYSLKDTTFYVRVLGELGVQHLILSNAAGSINADMGAGTFMQLEDHIYQLPDNPLRGKNYDNWGPRFPDMSEVYDRDIRKSVSEFANMKNIKCSSGVYLCTPGPQLETPAEYEAMHRLGADCVGMSTVPEVLVAKHMGMNVNAISLVTNLCYPASKIKATSVDDVIEVAQSKSSDLYLIVKFMIKKILQRSK